MSLPVRLIVVREVSLRGDPHAPPGHGFEQDQPGGARHIDAPLVRLDYRICAGWLVCGSGPFWASPDRPKHGPLEPTGSEQMAFIMIPFVPAFPPRGLCGSIRRQR
jgi:hypothetical protein